MLDRASFNMENLELFYNLTIIDHNNLTQL